MQSYINYFEYLCFTHGKTELAKKQLYFLKLTNTDYTIRTIQVIVEHKTHLPDYQFVFSSLPLLPAAITCYGYATVYLF